jgi:hypothetical protein
MEQPPACAGPNVLKKFLPINEVRTADKRDLVWTVQGQVIFRLANLSPSNAVVSGIFFGGY